MRALPGVAQAEGSVDSDATQLIGDDGKAVVFGGAPNLGFSIANGDSPFNPLTLVDGAWPGPNEVVVDKETASKEDFEVGETIGVQAEGPVEHLRVSGIVQFSSGLTIGGATLAGFDLPTAQRLFKKAASSTRSRSPRSRTCRTRSSSARSRRSCRRPRRCGRAASRRHDDAADTNDFISFLRGFLLAFGGIALFVGSFVIANSLSITIAQRTREFATLRTIGATNRQVLGSVIVEALVVGVVASIVGPLPRAPAREGAVQALRRRRLHAARTRVSCSSRARPSIALAAGILVTLLASVYPGLRATTVPPIAAVREGAVLPGEPLDRIRQRRAGGRDDRRRRGRRRAAITTTPGNTLVSVLLAVLGLLLTLFGVRALPVADGRRARLDALGFAALLYGLFVPGLGTTSVLLWMGVGVLLVFFGVARVSTRLIPRLAVLMSPIARWAVFLLAVLFWPFFTLPYWLLRHGAWGPGGVALRILAFLGGALLEPASSS